MSKRAAEDGPRLAPRLRVYGGKEIVLGPGKVELLGHIAECGSLSEAARRMEMSYMRAWLLLQIMNRSFREPLVLAERGGAKGGGAQLTELGRTVLELYREMEAESLKAMEGPWKRLQKLLRKAE